MPIILRGYQPVNVHSRPTQPPPRPSDRPSTVNQVDLPKGPEPLSEEWCKEVEDRINRCLATPDAAILLEAWRRTKRAFNEACITIETGAVCARDDVERAFFEEELNYVKSIESGELDE